MISEAPKPKVAKNPNRRLAYFRDDQITCLVTHQVEVVSDSQLRELINNMEEYLQGGQIVWPPRKFSFRALSPDEYPPPEDQPVLSSAFSVLFCDVVNVDDDPRHLLEVIQTLDVGLRNREIGGLTVQAVSPNWLASGASQAGGTGGPGSWPVPFRGMPSRAPYRFPELLSRLRERELYGDGEGVDVAILDTAPCGHGLIAAYKEYKNWHPLIRTLLGPTGKLKLYPATYDELLRMGSTSLNDHDYEMTDHGLFAAGLVHTIAPQATIHLIEVLNPFGVGDLATLAGGLEKVFRDIYRPGGRLVVNCSWMLNLPLEENHCYAESSADPDFEFERAILHMVKADPNPADSKREALALKTVCDRFGRVGGQVIAAAGNDWREASDRLQAPPARYPAAFLSAVGVGALPKGMIPGKTPGKFAASSYSNLADKPPTTGFATLGGEAGEEQGVLGLYLGEFPGCEPKPNCTKWAWWAGTSFATPILTGAIAAVLSSPKGLRTTQAALNELGTIILDKTDVNEDAFLVTQDY